MATEIAMSEKMPEEKPTLESLDEQRLAQKLAEARERTNEIDERELAEAMNRLEEDKNIVRGLPMFMSMVDRAFKTFYGAAPEDKRLLRYDELLRQFRIASWMYSRDIDALNGQPSFAVLETLDVQLQIMEQLARDMKKIDPNIPDWEDSVWRMPQEREEYSKWTQELCQRFSCQPEQIAREHWQINPDTKVYAGPLVKGIFGRLRHIEHIYIEPSQEEVVRVTIPVGDIRTEEEYVAAFKDRGVYENTYGLPSFSPPPVGANIEVVRLERPMLVDPETRILRKPSTICKMFGLRQFTTAEALAFQLGMFVADTVVDDAVTCETSLLNNEMVMHAEGMSLQVDLCDGPQISGKKYWWFVVPEDK